MVIREAILILFVWTLAGCALVSPDIVEVGVPQEFHEALEYGKKVVFPYDKSVVHPVYVSRKELFSIPPGAGEADEKLLSQLQSDSLKPVQVERILEDYGDKGAKMYFHTVGELATMCDLSLDKCSYEAFEHIIEIGNKYRVTVPKLYEYREYCIRTKLKKYCRDHAGEVVALLSKEVSKGDENLAERLIEPLRDTGIINDEEIVQAYFALVKDGLSLNDERDFLRRVKKSLFLYYFRSLGKGKSWFSDNTQSITAFDTLDGFVEHFKFPISQDIEKALYERASEGLKNRLMNKESATPEEVKKILQEYENKDVKICDNTVGDLTEMCIESSAKCSSAAFEHILSVSDECKQEVPKLFEYRRYCAKKLINYCRNHANEAQVGEDGEDLLPSLIESLQRAGALNKALGAPTDELKASIAEAYSQLKSSRHGSASVSLNEEKDFLDKVKRALFYRNVVVLGGSGDASAKRDEFYTIAETFVSSVSADIEKVFYATASEQLKSQLKATSSPQEVEKILQEYDDKEVQIYNITVGKYVEMCEESMKNCNFYVWDEILLTPEECKNDLRQLFQYRLYCAKDRVRGYCRKNINKLITLMMSIMSEAGKKLALGLASDVLATKGDLWQDSKAAYAKLEKSSLAKFHLKDLGAIVARSRKFLKKVCTRVRDFGAIKAAVFELADIYRDDKDHPKSDVMLKSRTAYHIKHGLDCDKFKITQ